MGGMLSKSKLDLTQDSEEGIQTQESLESAQQPNVDASSEPTSHQRLNLNDADVESPPERPIPTRISQIQEEHNSRLEDETPHPRKRKSPTPSNEDPHSAHEVDPDQQNPQRSSSSSDRPSTPLSPKRPCLDHSRRSPSRGRSTLPVSIRRPSARTRPSRPPLLDPRDVDYGVLLPNGLEVGPIPPAELRRARELARGSPIGAVYRSRRVSRGWEELEDQMAERDGREGEEDEGEEEEGEEEGSEGDEREGEERKEEKWAEEWERKKALRGSKKGKYKEAKFKKRHSKK